MNDVDGGYKQTNNSAPHLVPTWLARDNHKPTNVAGGTTKRTQKITQKNINIDVYSGVYVLTKTHTKK